MRRTLGNVARKEYYDRNPSNEEQASNISGIAPHTATQRWAYTVPAGKKALVTAVMGSVMRQTAATAVGVAATEIRTTAGDCRFIQAQILDNNVGAKETQTVGNAALLVEAEVLEGRTFDEGTGGTIAYYANAKVLEFDA